MSDYIKLADKVASEISNGTLKSGDQLPPQRTFAYERGIASSTASRVYAELLRRGLVIGEVGRGTFVAADAQLPAIDPREPRGARIDLEFNYPMLPAQTALISKSLEGFLRPDVLQQSLRQSTSGGTTRAREISSQFFSVGGWTPKPEQVAFTANGRQSLAAMLAALVPNGGRCGVEALTYPFIKGIAARLGITLVPLAMDEHGVRPDAIQKAHREGKLSAIYVQPVLQNPLGMTMPLARRQDLLRVVEKLDLIVLEDNLYGFLDDVPPLASLAPKSCVVLDSLSKRIAPGLTLGFIFSPLHLRESIMASIRAGGWSAAGYAFAAAQRLMSDGTAAEISKLKREDARKRQLIAKECLAGFDIQANPKAYHLWLTLPGHLRSQTFVSAAARQGIALSPSSTFAVIHGHAPNAIRLALALPTIDTLAEGLRAVADLLHSGDDDFHFTE